MGHGVSQCSSLTNYLLDNLDLLRRVFLKAPDTQRGAVDKKNLYNAGVCVKGISVGRQGLRGDLSVPPP